MKDGTSAAGLVTQAQTGLDRAHQYGLKLISGVRHTLIAGTSTPSDHNYGKAIDVSNGTKTSEEQAYADSMRGQPGVKYVIFNNRIASATNNWAWRPYTTKGANNPTNRHEDHVHVSYK